MRDSNGVRLGPGSHVVRPIPKRPFPPPVRGESLRLCLPWIGARPARIRAPAGQGSASPGRLPARHHHERAKCRMKAAGKIVIPPEQDHSAMGGSHVSLHVPSRCERRRLEAPCRRREASRSVILSKCLNFEALWRVLSSETHSSLSVCPELSSACTELSSVWRGSLSARSFLPSAPL